MNVLPINYVSIQPFLFAAFFWYPLREKVDVLKNEGGLNNHDAYALAGNEVLDQLCRSLAAPRRHTSVIRDIWMLQLQLLKRIGSHPARTMEHQKFRAAFDLLAMRAEVEGGETVELAKWWHEYQLSNQEQRRQLVQEQQKIASCTEEKNITADVNLRRLTNGSSVYRPWQQFKYAYRTIKFGIRGNFCAS